MVRAPDSTIEKDALSHNLLGQRLGRKGRGTRERILAATERLLAGPPDTAISLSAVAREASLGMTTLYLYFSDLPELLLAVLEPIMESAESSYLGHLRTFWPDDTLAENCQKFAYTFYDFWIRHSRILHLRNNYSDNNDERMRAHRMSSTDPIIALLATQMEGEMAASRSLLSATAVVLVTGIERIITIVTEPYIQKLMADEPGANVHNLLKAQARILELGIRDSRAVARGLTPP